MLSRCALLAIDAGGRSILRLMTPVGVFAFASERSCFISLSLHGWRERRLYFGFVYPRPFLPIGEPGRFHAGCAI
jgi:hypothetical protein